MAPSPSAVNALWEGDLHASFRHDHGHAPPAREGFWTSTLVSTKAGFYTSKKTIEEQKEKEEKLKRRPQVFSRRNPVEEKKLLSTQETVSKELRKQTIASQDRLNMVRTVVEDDVHWKKFQASLRQRGALTHLALQEHAGELLQERMAEIQQEREERARRAKFRRSDSNPSRRSNLVRRFLKIHPRRATSFRA